MSNSPVIRLVSVLLLALMICAPRISGATSALVLAGVHLEGTDQLSPEDVIRGLGLRLGERTDSRNLARACQRLEHLKVFGSLRCAYPVRGHRVWLAISVKPINMPVVFDNFVWTTKSELMARMKREIPLFMPDLPERSGLTGDIIRVLQEVVDERGIKGRVRYDASYWTIRGMNVFYVEGISTPVTGIQVEGENAPSPEKVAERFQFYTKENFSAARLTWVTLWIIRDFYKPRGYLRPVVGEPNVQFLGERDSTFPVRVVLHISPGDLYLFDSVEFKGLAKPHVPFLLSKWKLKPGDPYDEAYADNFISTAILDAPWAAHTKTESDVALSCTTVDAATKKVSLTITLETPRKARNSNGECEVMKQLAFPSTGNRKATGR
jgi:hypothetical protein